MELKDNEMQRGTKVCAVIAVFLLAELIANAYSIRLLDEWGGGVLAESSENSTSSLKTEYHEWNISALGEEISLWCNPVFDEEFSDIASVEYSWFQYDGELLTQIIGEDKSQYVTTNFSQPETRKYCCNVTVHGIKNGKETDYTQSYDYNVAYTGLPVVYISTDDDLPIASKTEKVHGCMRIISNQEILETEIQINGRGNTGWDGTPKKSYNFMLPNKVSILGMAPSRKWALIDNYHDRSLLRNTYVSYLNHNIFTKLGWNPSYVHVELVLNGEYVGNYLIAERNKIEKYRLNIPDISKQPCIEDGGFLCEINERFDERFNFRTTHGTNAQSGDQTGTAVSLKDPDDVSEVIQSRVQSIVQTAEDVLFSDCFRDPNEGYMKYFDIDSLIDWYLLHELVCMYDASSFYTSAYFYYDPLDEKIHMGPCWDYDTAMRGSESDLVIKWNNTWYSRLWEDKVFRKLVCNRWQEIRSQLMDSVSIIYEMADTINPSANYNFNRWPVLGTNYDGIEEWEKLKSYPEQIDFLVRWINSRINLLDEYYDTMIQSEGSSSG